MLLKKISSNTIVSYGESSNFAIWVCSVMPMLKNLFIVQPWSP
jgi:hypothetical protein